MDESKHSLGVAIHHVPKEFRQEMDASQLKNLLHQFTVDVEDVTDQFFNKKPRKNAGSNNPSFFIEIHSESDGKCIPASEIFSANEYEDLQHPAVVDLELLCSTIDKKIHDLPCKKSRKYYAGFSGSLTEDSEFLKFDDLKNEIGAFFLPMIGITDPQLFAGFALTFFPLHVEDCLFSSFSFLVVGAPKIWIIVPPQYAHLVRALALKLKTQGGKIHSSCEGPLEHKKMFIPPRILMANNIPFVIVKQEVGDIVTLTPNTFHQGLNCGVNVAQAVNFFSRQWLLEHQKPVFDRQLHRTGDFFCPCEDIDGKRGAIISRINHEELIILKKKYGKQIICLLLLINSTTIKSIFFLT